MFNNEESGGVSTRQRRGEVTSRGAFPTHLHITRVGPGCAWAAVANAIELVCSPEGNDAQEFTPHLRELGSDTAFGLRDWADPSGYLILRDPVLH